MRKQRSGFLRAVQAQKQERGVTKTMPPRAGKNWPTLWLLVKKTCKKSESDEEGHESGTRVETSVKQRVKTLFSTRGH